MREGIKQKINRHQPQGQMAVFLVFIITLIFILIAITANLGKISSYKTAVSNAADSAAISYASSVGSYANAIWYSVCVNMDEKNKYNEKDGGKYVYEFCVMNWGVFGTFLALIALIILTIVTWGATAPWLAHFLAATVGKAGAALGFSTAVAVGAGAGAMSAAAMAGMVIASTLTGAALATDIWREGSSLAGYTREISKLNPKGAIMEGVANYAMAQVVDDSKKMKDIHDINENGDLNDYIYRYNYVNTKRVSKIGSSFGLAVTMAERIGAFCLASDKFRQYLGGDQMFPELGFKDATTSSPDWITILKDEGYTTIPPNNRCYYQGNRTGGSTLVALMADFRAEKLKCDSLTLKELMNIMNLDLTNIGSVVLDANKNGVIDPSEDNLPEYKEEFLYYFPFWSHHPDINNPGRNPDTVDLPLEKGGGDPEDPGSGFPDPFKYYECVDLDPGAAIPGEKPNRTTALDEVDQIIVQLEQYRAYARGVFGWRYEGEDPDTGASIKYLTFLPGCGKSVTGWPDGLDVQMSDEDIQKSFNGWIRQLYDIDGLGGEQEKMTWYKQLQYMTNKTGGDDCGWYFELFKILQRKKFFGVGSDVSGDAKYIGLGTVKPPGGAGYYCGGKRLELKDKMKKVCDVLDKLIQAWKAKQASYCIRKDWDLPVTYPINITGGTETCNTKGTALATPPWTAGSCKGGFLGGYCFSVICDGAITNMTCINTLVAKTKDYIDFIKTQLGNLQNGYAQCQSCCSKENYYCGKNCDDRYGPGSACYGQCDLDHCNACQLGTRPDCGICDDNFFACTALLPNCWGLPWTDPCWINYWNGYWTCVDAYNTCMIPCWDWDDCRYECNVCQDACNDLANTCKNGPCPDSCQCKLTSCNLKCDTYFGTPAMPGPIQCREKELSELASILYYAEKLKRLGEALDYVENLIWRVQEGQQKITDFNGAASSLVSDIEAYWNQLKDLDNYINTTSNKITDDTVGGAWMESKVDGSNFKVVYNWPTTGGNNATIRHEVRVSVGDCKLASGKGKRCRWVFGRGGELIDHTSFGNGGNTPDLTVTVSRMDESSNLVLRFFQWLFQSNVVTATATAAYSPRENPDGSGGIKLISAN